MHQIFSLFPRSSPPSPSFQSDVGTEDRGSEGEGEQPKRKGKIEVMKHSNREGKRKKERASQEGRALQRGTDRKDAE